MRNAKPLILIGIPNPTICLNEGEVVIWMLYTDDEGVKHFPAYLVRFFLNHSAGKRDCDPNPPPVACSKVAEGGREL